MLELSAMGTKEALWFQGDRKLHEGVNPFSPNLQSKQSRVTLKNRKGQTLQKCLYNTSTGSRWYAVFPTQKTWATIMGLKLGTNEPPALDQFSTLKKVKGGEKKKSSSCLSDCLQSELLQKADRSLPLASLGGWCALHSLGKRNRRESQSGYFRIVSLLLTFCEKWLASSGPLPSSHLQHLT